MIHSDNVATSVTVYRTVVEGKTEILSFTMEPPDPNLELHMRGQMIVVCVASPWAFRNISAVQRAGRGAAFVY